MSVLLEATSLTKRYGGIVAVNEVSLKVSRGEIVSLIGPNGAGKSTCLNLISRVTDLTSGTLRLGGADISRRAGHDMPRLGVARTFQNLALFRSGSVVENMLVGRHTRMRSGVLASAFYTQAVRREEVANREAVERIIDFLEIEGIRDAVVGSLPYGLQKRVELGRALAVEPQLLLIDEMVSGMNQEETEDIARFILDARDEFGITVLMVEHDLAMVMGVSDRVYVMNFGKLIAEGTPSEVSANPEVIKAYIGGHSDLGVKQ